MKQVRAAKMRLADGFVHYLAMGSGPPLLLLHSLASSSRSWLQVIEPLSQDFAVYALDTLGQGDSDKPSRDYTIEDYAEAVTGFVRALGLESVRLMGNSMGAVVATEVASAHPGTVERLVLVGCVCRENDDDRLAMLEKVRRQYDTKGNPKPRVAEDLQGVLYHVTPEALAMVNEDRKKAGVWGWKASVAVNSYDMMSRLPLIRCRTLLAYGAQDAFQEKKQVLLNGIQGSEMVIIERAGHLPQVDAPRDFVKAVVPFLKHQMATAED